MTLVRPLGMILPGATATMSTVPSAVQARATQKTPITAKERTWPTGDGGVSTISSAAGRNASSSVLRARAAGRERTIFSTNFMETCLGAIQRGVSPTPLDEIVVRAVLDQPTPLDRHDPL